MRLTRIHRNNTYPTKMNTNSQTTNIQLKRTQIHRDNTYPIKINTNSQRQPTSNQKEHKLTETTHSHPKWTQIHRDKTVLFLLNNFFFKITDNTCPTNRNTNLQRQHTSNRKEHKFSKTTHIHPTGTQIHRYNTYPTKQERGGSMVPDPDWSGGMKGGLHFERFRNNLQVLGPCPFNISR